MSAHAAHGPGAIALVVVNYGSHGLIERNLAWADSYAEGEASLFRVIVVNNPRSHEDSVAITRLVAGRGWSLVECATNVGFGSAVNLGAKRAWELGCSAMIVVNPDVVISADQAATLGRAALSKPKAMTSPLILGPDGRPWAQLGRIDMGRGRLWTTDDHEGPAWLSGACLCVHRELWNALGGFDDDYFMYWEDIDLSYRCVRAGGALLLQDDVVVTHDIGGTQTESVGKSPLYVRYNCRNRLVFASKHLGLAGRLKWTFWTPADVRRVISRGTPRGRLQKFQTAVPPAVAGCLAGLAWVIAPSVAARRAAGRRRTADQ